MVLRAFVALLLLCLAPRALAMEAQLSLEKPETALALGGWAKVEGLDATWEGAAVSGKEERKHEMLELAVELSPVSAHFADAFRTKRPIEALYLRVADDAAGERFYRLTNVVVVNFARAPSDRPEAMEMVAFAAERIERVSK